MSQTPTASFTVFDDLASALGVSELVPLAQGGQKFVLRALRAGRPVAVKAMLVQPGPGFAAALDRARRETRVLAAVDSPRLVRLLDAPRILAYEGKLPYGIAWIEELLDGEDLDSLLGVPWEGPQAARLLVHLAEALAALHEKGIAHRDLTPGNVRRRADGRYCLLDPGLASFLDEPDPGDAQRFGTIGYRSPEHAQGTTVAGPGDVFCLGVLVHQALTGRPPIDPGLTVDAERALLERCDFPALHTLRPELPEALSRVVRQCLLADPAHRFADGRALLDELARHEDVFAPFFASAEAALVSHPAEEAPPTAVFGPTALGYRAAPDQRSVLISGAFGERRLDVDSIAADQEPFALSLSPYTGETAPGITFTARTIDLGDGRMTNSYELAIDPRTVEVGAHSDPAGFHLSDILDDSAALAALSGSFSFISDDADYQPAEPCLDFCVRDGVAVSLPTATKPAFLVGAEGGGVSLQTLTAEGELLIGDERHAWVGSKTARAAAFPDAAQLLVFGAANCRVRYTEAERTGFLRDVERSGNRTPADAGALDLVVVREGSTLRVRALHKGGGADLFEGCFVLRGRSAQLSHVRPGDVVRVASVGGVDCTRVSSGFSIGPSVADAARGAGLEPYDESLGLSPFLPGSRYARTLMGLDGGLLRLRVFDGAPLSRSFQGVSCAEAVRLLADEDGLDPALFHHLDGGQSAKLAVRHEGAAAVFGSMHYLLWPKQGEGEFQWQGTRGRVLRSALRIGPARR
jgi:hypothetical protein